MEHYKLEINLERMAMLRIATLFWNKPIVRKKINEFVTFKERQFVLDDRQWQYTTDARGKWHQLVTKPLLKYVSFSLPPLLESELIHLIKELGLKIYNWYKHIEDASGYNNQHQNSTQKYVLNYIETIYWTNNGSINKAKIIKDFWIGNANLDVNRIYNMAFNYICEETDDEYKTVSSERYLVSLWKKYFKDRDCPSLIKYFDSAMWEKIPNVRRLRYNHSHSVDENMLRLTVSRGYSEAAKYFWSKLNEDEKNRNIVNCTHTAIIKHNAHEHKLSHKQDSYVEICLFLLKRMTTDQKQELFNEQIERHYLTIKIAQYIFKMLLSAWPWQEFLISTLEEMWRYPEDTEKNHYAGCTVLYEITLKMLEDYELGFPVQDAKYQTLLHKVWSKMPVHLKRNIFKDKFYQDFMWNLLYMTDLTSIKLIVKCSDIPEKEMLLKIKQPKYLNFLMNRTLEELKQFVQDLSIPEEQKGYLKRSIYFIQCCSKRVKSS